MAIDIGTGLKTAVDWFKQDFKDLTYLRQSYTRIDPGLYTYKFRKQSGWENRIHLRVDHDGGGKLFVDVTDVIQLDPISMEIVKLALDGCEKPLTKKLLTQRYRGSRQQISQDIDRMYLVVEHFLEGTDGCQTCALTGLLSTAPLFELEAGAPYKVDLALTYGCNNQCPHCYNEAGRLGMPSLPLEKWKQVLDKIARIGIPHIILTGGEATLHPDFLEIVEYADKLGMVVGLNSNGRSLSNRELMQAAARAGLNHVQITLGSSDPQIHDRMMGGRSFDQTVSGIKTAIESGVHVITNTTLIRSNMKQAGEIIDFIYELGVRTFAMNGMIYSGGGFANPEAINENELLPLLYFVKNHAEQKGMRFLWYTPTEYCRFSPFEIEIGVKRCNAGEYSVCIEPNGDVLPCQSYYVPAGNILTNTWEEIWDSQQFHSFRDRKTDPQGAGLPEKCWDCPEFSVCGGGCRIEREARQGIQVTEISGGGCIGCTGFSPGPEERRSGDELLPVYLAEEGGYVPTQSQQSRKKRSSGSI